MGSRLLRLYAVGQALAIGAFFFVPLDGWLHTIWQLVVGWGSAAFVVMGTRRYKPEGSIAWYLFSAGLALNATGVLVEMILVRVFHNGASPNAADLCYLAIFPCLIGGLSILAYRRTAAEDVIGLATSTAGCVVASLFLGVFAWEFIVWEANNDRNLEFAKRLVVTAYPLGDMMVIAVLLRLVFGGAAGTPAFFLMLGSLCSFLVADVGWSKLIRTSTSPTPIQQHLLEMASMTAFALMGAAALHPSTRKIAAYAEGHRPRLSAIGWAALGLSMLTAPTVLLVQAILDRLYSLNSL